MSENGNELLMRRSAVSARIDESSVPARRTLLSIQLQCDKLCKILEHPDDLGPV